MKSTHLLAGLLAVLFLLSDLVVITLGKGAPDTALMLLGGLACGQLALLTAWSVCGCAPWLLRVLAVLGLAALLAVPFSAATVGRWPEWSLVLSLFAGCVGLPWWFAHRCGWPVGNASRSSWRGGPQAQPKRFQFSLGTLLSWLTLVAVASSLHTQVSFPWPYVGELACYGVCLAGVAVGSFWTLAVPGRVGLRVAGLALLCIVAGGIMSSTTGMRNLWFFTMVAFIEAVIICFGWTVCASARPSTGGELELTVLRNPAVRCTGMPAPASRA